MPAGPACQRRVEAERRALTTPSTAPASQPRWCDVWIWVCNSDASAGNTFDAPDETSVQFASCIRPANVARKTCTLVARVGPHIHCANTATCDTTNDGVNDPVSTAWGHTQGTTPGSFTPSLVHRLRHCNRR
jgi:hypothetical protein